MTWPFWKLSIPTTCVARSTARWAAPVAINFAKDASASDGESARCGFPGHEHGRIELRRRVSQKTLYRLLSCRCGMRCARGRQRFAERTLAHSEPRRRCQNANTRHDRQCRAERLTGRVIER